MLFRAYRDGYQAHPITTPWDWPATSVPVRATSFVRRLARQPISQNRIRVNPARERFLGRETRNSTRLTIRVLQAIYVVYLMCAQVPWGCCRLQARQICFQYAVTRIRFLLLVHCLPKQAKWLFALDQIRDAEADNQPSQL